MDKNLQALFRAKADERGSAKPSVAEMRAMRKAQKQPQPPVAAAPAAAMPPPPPRNPQPMQPPPPRPVHAPASEKGIVEASPVGREVTAEEPAGKRMRVEEPQSVPSTSAPSVAAPAGALPAGFFDNRQLDKKARGVEQPKLDPKQEWKLFQESVQEEIQELENKEVEEQEQEALLRTDELVLEQQEHLSRVAKLREEALRRKAENRVKQEGAGAGAATGLAGGSAKGSTNAADDESGSDDDEDELVLGSLLDWRARGTA